MRSNLQISNEHLPTQHNTQHYSGIKAANIFKLVSDVVETSYHTCIPYDTNSDNLKFAEYCLKFLSEVHPETLKDLVFDESKDDLATYTGCLVHKITALEYKISYSASEPCEFINIQYYFPYEETWYFLQLKFLNRIKNKGLKIGYAHLIESFDTGCTNSLTEYSFAQDDKYEATPMDYLYEDAVNYSETNAEAKIFAKNFLQYKNSCYNTLKKYVKLKNEPIEKFYKTRPRNAVDKELKKLISQGLGLNLSLTHAFADDDGWDDGCTPYFEFHKILFDCSHPVEEEWTEGIADGANHHGFICPMGWYRVDENEVKLHTSPEVIEEFSKGCQLINDIDHFLVKNK